MNSQQTYYQREKSRYYKWAEKRRRRNKAFIDALKSEPCADCKNVFPTCVMDLDHREGKVLPVSVLVGSGYSLEKIKAEAAKCDVVCANCHRLRTEARGYSKGRPRGKTSPDRCINPSIEAS